MGRNKLRERAARVLQILREQYPEAECALHHENPWQLLCATILSAQCTDARVNLVTPQLFARYPTPEAMAAADPEELESLIRPTGFFRQKAKSLMAASQDIVALHGGEVPQTMEELTQLRGVGRKTANVVIGVAFGGDGVVVDTHVRRISRRLGWTEQMDPTKIERDLMELHPRKMWTPLAHILILHGRTLCTARSPACGECPALELCPFGTARVNGAQPKRRPPAREEGGTGARE